jgi:hypothetical protein
MKKVIRLTESDLQRLIKRVIKETEEQTTDVEEITPDELNDLDVEIQRIDAKLEPTDLGSPTEVSDEEGINSENIDQAFQEKIGEKKLTQVYQKNKQYIDQEVSNIKSIADKYDLCTRRGRRDAKRELRNKITEYLGKIVTKKANSVNEQIGPGLLLAAGWIIVMFIIMFWRRIVVGDGCRRWGRMKHNANRPPRGYYR